MGVISEFFDTVYSDYAVYRVVQRLPHILDGLGQTQRKVIYSLLDEPVNKDFKTLEMYSKLLDKTQYLHGDMSVYNVVESMARQYDNNINLLTAGGDFGVRTTKQAAAPRYTSTKLSEAARVIFKNIDNPLFYSQEFEGQEIEPEFLLPIIPIALVNGYDAIAVGYSSKFLSRNPSSIIKGIKEILESLKAGKSFEEIKVQELIPAFPFFKGSIEQAGDNSWIIRGVVEKIKGNKIRITEIPPQKSREGIIEKLNKMKENGLVKDFTESCVKNTFDFVVHLPKEMYQKSTDELCEFFGLVEKFTENFTFLSKQFDITAPVEKISSAEEYLKIFTTLRLGFYEKRKLYLLEKIKNDLKILRNKINFIQAIVDKKLQINNRKKNDIEKDMQKMVFDKIEGSWDYLLGMKIFSLTEEKIKELENKFKKLRQEYDNIQKEDPKDIYIAELEELLEIIKPEMIAKGISWEE